VSKLKATPKRRKATSTKTVTNSSTTATTQDSASSPQAATDVKPTTNVAAFRSEAAARFFSLAERFRNTAQLAPNTVLSVLLDAGDELLSAMRSGVLPSEDWLEWFDGQTPKCAAPPHMRSHRGVTESEILDPRCRLYSLWVRKNLQSEIWFNPDELSNTNLGMTNSEARAHLIRQYLLFAKCCEAIGQRIKQDVRKVMEEGLTPTDQEPALTAIECDVLLAMADFGDITESCG